MSDCPAPAETPSSGEQEPTMVSVPVVGSSASDNMATSWGGGSPAQLGGAMCSASPSSSSPFLHPGIDADSTSESLEDRMSLSVHAIAAHETSRGSDNSEEEDHLGVVDNITAQDFLRESDLMDAASSALGHEKEADEELDKSDLLSSLEHPSGARDHIESLLREQRDISDYHLDRASELSVGSASQLDMGGGGVASPSSNSSASSLDLPGVSSSVGLPPVSTIIRSSAKGRFDVFCRPSNMGMIMDIPQFLGNDGSFDPMASMNSIQRLTSSPCDGLGNVSLASPMEVSSSRHNNTCTDVVMESVDVPLSSSLVCSSAAISHCASIVESRCIKANTVMSSLGPVMLEKHALSEMTDTRLESEADLNLPITSTSSIPNFINVPLREIMHFSTSPSQVSQHLSPMAIEEMQKVAEINEHLRSGVGTPYALHSGDESIAMLSPHFGVTDGIQHPDGFVERSRPASVSAIETNVIMSTSNIDTSPKFSAAEIKAIEQKLRTEHSRGARDEIEGTSLNSEVIIPDCIETTQSSDIIYSNVQNALDNDAETRKILKAHNIMRSTIIEKNLLQSHVVKNDTSVITSPEGAPPNDVTSVGAAESHNGDTVTIKTNKKLATSQGRQDPMPNVGPSAVTASVIQQLLRTQSPPSKLRSTLQHIPRGVITSVMSSKGDSTEHQEILISSSATEPGCGNVKKDARSAEISVTAANILQNSNLMDSLVDNSKDKSITVTIGIPEQSVISRGGKSPSPIGDKDAGLPHLNSTVLPSLFSNLSASALASLQSSLSSALPLTIQSSLPNISLGESTSTASISPVLSSPPLSPILLPNILSTTLRTAGTKPGDTNCVTSSTGATNHLYGGLLKTVGLAGVKQEAGSGPLPPFTVVSGLVKREFGQIPVVTIKQEPGIGRAGAPEFGPSIVLSAGTALPGIASIRLPNTAVQLPVVVATTAAPEPAGNPAVPSQASTIAFAVSTSSSVVDPPAREAEDGDEAADDCPMCENGSPCGLHPTTQARRAPAPPPPQPVLSGDPAKPFRCTLCGKHLASKNVYQLHLRSHSGEKPFTCNLCGHHFSQKTSLTRHMRSHTGERPFPCDVCGKRFADKERIKIHMRTHTGEKPFACEVCGKRFSQKSTVKRHMSVHTGEKPFKCESCGKGFANRGNLNAHSKTHANT